MDKEEISKELKKRSKLAKKRLKFESISEEIDFISYIEDMAHYYGYIGNKFSRQIINYMIETFCSWIPDIYLWVHPQQTKRIQTYKIKKISKEEKREMEEMLDEIMYLSRKNKRLTFKGLKKEDESEFIRELIRFDKEKFTPFISKYYKKFEKVWKEEKDKKITSK